MGIEIYRSNRVAIEEVYLKIRRRNKGISRANVLNSILAKGLGEDRASRGVLTFRDFMIGSINATKNV